MGECCKRRERVQTHRPNKLGCFTVFRGRLCCPPTCTISAANYLGNWAPNVMIIYLSLTLLMHNLLPLYSVVGSDS